MPEVAQRWRYIAHFFILPGTQSVELNKTLHAFTKLKNKARCDLGNALETNS